MVEEPRERDLLLVAAGELRDALGRAAGADREPVDPVARRAVALREADPPEAAHGPEAREREVVLDRKSERETFALAVLGEEPDALREARSRRGPRVAAPPPTATVPLRMAVEAEDRAQALGAARADEAGDPEDLARAHLEGRRAAAAAVPADVLDAQGDVARRVRRRADRARRGGGRPSSR